MPTRCGVRAGGAIAVVWEGLSNAKAEANGAIVKKGGGTSWNAGAHSRRLASGDVTLQFRCSVKQRTMIGLAIGNSGVHYNDIDCAMYCDAGTLRVQELGKHQWNGPAYKESDLLAVKRVYIGGIPSVVYQLNGKAVRYCKHKLSGPVLADLSMYDDGRSGVLEASFVQRARLWELRLTQTIHHGYGHTTHRERYMTVAVVML